MSPNGDVILNIAVCVLPDLMGICGMPMTNSLHGVGTVRSKGVHHDTSRLVVFDFLARVTQMLHLKNILLALVAHLENSIGNSTRCSTRCSASTAREQASAYIGAWRRRERRAPGPCWFLRRKLQTYQVSQGRRTKKLCHSL